MKPTNLQDKIKYVYLIQSLENSYYKIGVSKHPQQRVGELQTGNQSPLKLVEMYPSDYAFQIERALQARHSHLRREGEWFEMSIENEVAFINECKKIEENLIFLKKNGNVFL
jgi:hypothetical protein